MMKKDGKTTVSPVKKMQVMNAVKRKTAKELLAETFRELAQTKPIDKITVKDLTEACGYSTATFYRQFKDKYDLIAWDYARDLEAIIARADGGRASWRQVLSDAADYYAARREYISNLILHTTGHDSFVTYMTEINYQHLHRMIFAAAGADNLSEQTGMLIRAYCLGTVNLTCEWILGRYAADKDALQEIYEQALPQRLRAFIA